MDPQNRRDTEKSSLSRQSSAQLNIGVLFPWKMGRLDLGGQLISFKSGLNFFLNIKWVDK